MSIDRSYRRLAIAILGLDVETLTARLAAERYAALPTVSPDDTEERTPTQRRLAVDRAKAA